MPVRTADTTAPELESNTPAVAPPATATSATEAIEITPDYQALVRATTSAISTEIRNLSPDPEAKEAVRQRLTDEELRSLQIEQDGRKQYFELRKKWSWALFAVLMTTLLFQFTLVVLVGRKFLTFAENKYLVEIICSGNFVQVIGLVYIVVRFLFPSSQPSPQPSSTNSSASSPEGPAKSEESAKE